MTRHPGLDAARATAIVLVVAGHAALSYLVTPIGWAIQDSSHHIAFDVGVFFVSAFIMPAFFWLSGYFARGVYLQRGPAGYLRHRATRLAVPIAVAIVPCSLALDALWDWGRELAVRQTVDAGIPKLEGSKLPITLGHLWFLYYVLIISIVVLIAVELARRLWRPRPGTVSAMWIVPAAAVASTLVLVESRAWHLDTPLGFPIHLRALVYFTASSSSATRATPGGRWWCRWGSSPGSCPRWSSAATARRCSRAWRAAASPWRWSSGSSGCAWAACAAASRRSR